MADTHAPIETRVWWISAVVVVGSMMSILDTTIVNVALATLGRELDASVAQIQELTPLRARRPHTGSPSGPRPR